MYEAEVNHGVESIDTLPAAIISRFAEMGAQLGLRTTLPWGEHCTECNFPVCYTSCELYSPRTDGACRLFINGAVRIDCRDAVNSYLLKIQFKQWGKLWTVGNLALSSRGEALAKERANLRVGTIARTVPLPSPIKRRVLSKVNYLRRSSAEEATASAESPDCFVLECYNPNPRTIPLTLSVRLRQDKSVRPFQTVIKAPEGFTRAQVAFSDISRVVDLSQAFEVEIVPNECDGTVLYFGLVDFVKLAPKPDGVALPAGAMTWKCIVWDLDNTLWDGTLIEDGPDKIRIRQEVVDLIKETDRRGILHSVASKNNHDDAFKILRMCGLDEYFLYPQINWQPKSQAIARIAQLLNIGADTLAFVDDQPFEREEVQAALPQVSVIDTADFRTLLQRSECQVPITQESRQRRQMYRQQEERKTVLETFNGDYEGYLKECLIRLTIGALNEENLERVYELAQRTNQMNFSGNRYPRPQLREIMASQTHHTFVIRCSDRFGEYGIVGFAVVDIRELRLLDLMFSCRVQAKRVEHAFLGFLLERYARSPARDFFVNYRKSPKNEASGRVFEELGFEWISENDGLTALVFRKELPLPDQAIIEVRTEVSATA
jgi:FkbH-like protein